MMLLPLSGPNTDSLDNFNHSIETILSNNSIQDVCHTIGRQVKHKYRNCLITDRTTQTISQSSAEASISRNSSSSAFNTKLAFVFNGMGGKLGTGGIDVYRNEPVFRSVVDVCETVLKDKYGISAIGDYFRKSQIPFADDLASAHSLHFTLQVATCELWKSWGVEPSVVIAHSLGEISAACSAGSVGVVESIRIIVERAKVLQEYSGQRAMLAAAVSVQRAEGIVNSHPGKLFIASENSKKSVTFSGTSESVLSVMHDLEADGIFCALLDISVPFHSPLIENGKKNFLSKCSGITVKQNQIRWLSSVFGQQVDIHEIGDDYWWDNFRCPVKFQDCMHSAIESGVECFVEIGPHPILSYSITECLELSNAPGHCLYSLHREKTGSDTMRANAAALFNLGFDLNWNKINPEAEVVEIECLKLNRKVFWLPEPSPKDSLHGLRIFPDRTPLLELPDDGSSKFWNLCLDPSKHSWLEQHRIHGEVIYPAAGYVEAALEAGLEIYDQLTLELLDIEFIRMLQIPQICRTSQHACTLSAKIHGESYCFEFQSHENSPPMVFCRGRIRAISPHEAPEVRNGMPPRSNTSSRYSIDTILQKLGQLEFEGDCSSWSIVEADRISDSEMFVKLENNYREDKTIDSYLLDPALLDICFRLSTLTFSPTKVLVPRKIDSLTLRGNCSSHVWCHLQSNLREDESVELNLKLFDEQRRTIAVINRLVLSPLDSTAQSISSRTPRIDVPRWVMQEPISTHNQWFEEVEKQYRKNIRDYVDDLINYCDRSSYYQTNATEFTEICLSMIGDCFSVAGISKKGDQILVSHLTNNLKVVDSQLPLLYSLLALLQKHQFVDISDGDTTDLSEYTVTAVRDLPQGGHSAVSEFFQNPESSKYVQELTLLDRCGEFLGKVLQGKESGLNILFPHGDITGLQQFYQSSATCRIYNEAVTRCVSELLEHWPFDRKCKILELGGGTGSLLFHLIPILGNHEVEYTFTDISSSFVRHVKGRYQNLEWIQCREFDFNSDPNIQGFPDDTFDVVVASDCLHLARHPDVVFSGIRNILCLGGFLFFVELTNEPDWARLVFGMSRDWWHNATENVLHNTSCHTSDEWLKFIKRCGFKCVEVLTDQKDSENSLHCVFVTNSTKVSHQQSLERKQSRQQLVFSDDGEFSNRFVEALGTGHVQRVVSSDSFDAGQVYTIRPNALDDYVQLVESVVGCDQLPAEIIMLWNFSSDRKAAECFEDLIAETPFAMKVSHLIRAYDQLAQPLPMMTLVSANIHHSHSPLALSSCFDSSIWAVGRTIRNEYPHCGCRIIDVDINQDNCIEELVQVIAGDEQNLEVSLRLSGKFVPTLKHLTKTSLLNSSDQNLTLACSRPGDLNSLGMQASNFPQCSESAVIVKVLSASLNFRDVMVALDALPQQAVANGYAQRSLGIECAGEVVMTGQNVTSVAVGDQVVALCKNAMSKFVTVNEEFVFPMTVCNYHPEQISGIPTALVTAVHSFDSIANIHEKGSILIHAASGGVGLMFLHLARDMEFEIFATAGNESKTRLLNSMGVDRVSDSRSDRFVDDILNWTDGTGVDIVVNSLSNDLAQVNSKIISSNGHFIELGKYESMNHVHRLISEAKPGVEIHTIDIDLLWNIDPARLASIFERSMKLVVNDKIPMPVYQTFSIRNAVDAFKFMASAKHIGKVILSLKDLHLVSSSRSDEPRVIKSDATYVVCGGSRGFGLATVRWLCDLGARHILIISRNPNDAEQLSEVKSESKRAGISIETIACDVTALNELQREFKQAVRQMPPIRGVIHCAMEIEDRALVNLDINSYGTSTAAKIQGAWNLYKLTESDRLDFYILYSSITSLIGPSGQAAYAAANAFIDSFARYLNEHSVSAVSVNWGAISDCGHVAEHVNNSDSMRERYGVQAMPAQQMLSVLEQMELTECGSQLVISGGDWFPSSKKESDGNNSAKCNAIESLEINSDRLPGGKAQASDVRTRIFDCISNIVGIPANEIDLNESLLELGIDSLQAVELSHQLRMESGIQVSAAALLDSVSIQDIMKLA